MEVEFYGGPLDGERFPAVITATNLFTIDEVTHRYAYRETFGRTVADYAGVVRETVAR